MSGRVSNSVCGRESMSVREIECEREIESRECEREVRDCAKERRECAYV